MHNFYSLGKGLSLLFFVFLTGCSSTRELNSQNSDIAYQRAEFFSAENVASNLWFTAKGMEPDWTLHLWADSGKLITADKEISLKHIKFIRSHRFGEWFVQMNNGRDSLQAVFSRSRSYKTDGGIKVMIKDLHGDVKYHGQGFYPGDYRLHDIWALDQIGTTITKGLMDVPTIQFHINTGKVLGFGGCNEFSGSIFFDQDWIKFSRLKIPKTNCENSSIEARFMRAISARQVRYQIQDGILTIYSGQVQMKFRKVD